MGTATAEASNVIALPSGGGALQGIGEKFAPDLHTGTGNFSVPITVPPGRNGFQPGLSLAYSTGSGNGPFGLGWSLSVPGVSRQTSKGVPRYDDARDVFILSGAEDLVPVPGAPPGATRYRPRTEGLFARIDHYPDADPEKDRWEVRTKDGLVSAYGGLDTGGEPAAIVGRRPDQPDVPLLFAWKLTRTTDTFGNRIEYRYIRDEERSHGAHHWDQLYLSEIRYVDYGDPEDPQFLVTVRFVYAPRPDPFSDYRGGFEIRTVQRCTRIEIRTHADETRLVRTYHLDYLDERGLPPSELPPNGASLLSRVRVVGHDGDQSEALPPLELGYTTFEPERRDFFPVEGPDTPPGSLRRPEYELADLIGNGLPDVLEMNGTVRYWRNLGGRFDRPREMREAPAGVGLADPGVQLLDADGDGRLDLLVTTDTLSGYFPLRFGGFWDRRSFQPYRLAPSFALDDPEVRLIDLDGDGVTDAIRSGARLECFFNDPKEGWNGTRRVERRSLEEFPNVSFADERVRLADMNGDGLQDVVLVYDGCVEYWPSLGRGDWAGRISMGNAPRLPFGYDPKRVLLGDVDGDGLADLAYVDDTRVCLWINQGGNAWSDPIEIRGTPPVSDQDEVRIVDLLGNGVAGILWSADASSLTRAGMFFLDFTGGTKPYLLNEMDNHLGAVTRVGYAPSTRLYLEDERRPETRWQTPLPFPVQVVARVEVLDQISGGKLTTEYRYHHGYWDGVEREFRGFGRVDQRDSEVFERYNAAGLHGPGQAFEPVARQMFSPPTETRIWFHQGPIDGELGDWREADYTPEYWPGDPPALLRPAALDDLLRSLPRSDRRDALRSLRGNVLRTELYALEGSERQDRPFTVTETLYGLREEAPPGPDEDGRRRIFFPHPLAQRATRWERGEDPMTQLTFTDDYDAYGHPRSQIAIAVPRGRDERVAAAPGEPYLATRTATDHIQRDDAHRYLAGRVARTTTYEIVNDGSPSAFELCAAILAGSVEQRVIGQTLSFFDGPAFQGLPFGQLGDHGLVSRTETLVLTDQTLRDAYRGDDVAEIPPYLATGGAPPWTDEYPEQFRQLLPTLAGYLYRPGGPDSPHERGYFVLPEQRQYDCQVSEDGTGRGLLLATRDPLGRATSIEYDAYDLFAARVADPAGLETGAVYDYRAMRTSEVTDPNRNRTAYRYSPLGMVERIATMGKPEEPVGDTLDAPGTRFLYDFRAFAERGQPAAIRTVRRVHHANQADVAPDEADQTVETVEYSDGFGRLIQSRTQAEDLALDSGLLQPERPSSGDGAVSLGPAPGGSPRVVVSGWQVYDNKGRVVAKYEPFFSTGWEYAPPTDAQLGERVVIVYDAGGQVIRTISPDGSEHRVVHGIPIDLADPDRYVPSPWEAYLYDGNDNAGRTHPTGSNVDAGHWNTPSSIVSNALGKPSVTIARNGPDPSTDWLTTRFAYDVRGNLLTVQDPLGRTVSRSVYDLLNRPLRIEQPDAGVRRTIADAAGNLIEQRDTKGALKLHAFDRLNRPIRFWARDRADEPLTLRERVVYADAEAAGLPRAEASRRNLLGRAYQHYDEAGRLTFEAFDFKGNTLERVRRVLGDAQILDVFRGAEAAGWQIAPFRVDWEPPAGVDLAAHAARLLAPTEYRVSSTFDGLNRPRSLRYPTDVTGGRKELRARYSRAGGLERVLLDGTPCVDHIAYDAKGRRTFIAYGNGVMTRYAYEPRTFRLARLRSERYERPAPFVYRPTGLPVQDLRYSYDLAGNITGVRDNTPGSGIRGMPLGPDTLERAFTYDPVYRLISATGRECDAPTSRPPWDDRPLCVDPSQARGYTERYAYDRAGNLARQEHHAGNTGFTRVFAAAADGNRLATATIGETTFTYQYDGNGNLLRETSSRHFEWDHSDRLRTFRTQVAGSEPSIYSHYCYDAAGRRVKKLVRKQGGVVEATVYVDGLFEHHRIVQPRTVRENNSLHIMDGQHRIAHIRVGPPFPDDAVPAVTFHLGDHRHGSEVVLDESGGFVNREEYAPFGETSFGTYRRKRYRFGGKERDEESGLYYYGARYYAPWLGRWVSFDAIELAAPGASPDATGYVYTHNNPMTLIDPAGLWSWGKALGFVASVVVGTAATAFVGGLLTPLIGPVAAGVVGGAVGGALGGAVGAAVEGLVDEGKVDWGKVGDAALTGAAFGAAFGAAGVAVSGGVAGGIAAKIAGSGLGKAVSAAGKAVAKSRPGRAIGEGVRRAYEAGEALGQAVKKAFKGTGGASAGGGAAGGAAGAPAGGRPPGGASPSTPLPKVADEAGYSSAAPVPPKQVREVAAKFEEVMGDPPEAIAAIGSHTEGAATAGSDIDIALVTPLGGLEKQSGKGWEFFKLINPGKVPPGVTGIGPNPGQTWIGTGPGEIPKPGLLDPFFKGPADVFPPYLLLWPQPPVPAASGAAGAAAGELTAPLINITVTFGKK